MPSQRKRRQYHRNTWSHRSGSEFRPGREVRCIVCMLPVARREAYRWYEQHEPRALHTHCARDQSFSYGVWVRAIGHDGTPLKGCRFYVATEAPWNDPQPGPESHFIPKRRERRAPAMRGRGGRR